MLQLSLHYSLRLKTLLFTLKISFLLFFHNLLFQNMLINLAEKESPQRVLLNIWHKCDRSIVISQPAISCSKLTIETLAQGVKYVHMFKNRIFHPLF